MSWIPSFLKHLFRNCFCHFHSSYLIVSFPFINRLSKQVVGIKFCFFEFISCHMDCQVEKINAINNCQPMCIALLYFLLLDEKTNTVAGHRHGYVYSTACVVWGTCILQNMTYATQLFTNHIKMMQKLLY